MVLGGADLTNAFVGSYSSTGPGTQAITGVGFTPDLVIATHIVNVPNTPGGFNTASMNISAFASPTLRGALSFRDTDAANPTQSSSYQRSDEAVTGLSSGSDTINYEADLSSMDADGFTLNYTTNLGTAGFGYLALKGGKYDVRVETQKTSSGTKSTTGIGFTPTGLLLMGTNATASTSINTTQAKLSIGGSDGTTEGAV